MATISVQSTDTLFFRDGRPFSMGEESFARGVFPPHPSVLHGAIRSVFIADQVNSGQDIKQGIEQSEKFSIGFIALKQQTLGRSDEELWLPMPNDLIVYKTDKDEAASLRLRPIPQYSNLKLFDEVPTSLKEDKTIDGRHLIALSSFENYLNGTSNVAVKHISEFVSKETKIGIGRNYNSRTVDDGKLFRVLMNRPAVSRGKAIEKLSFVIKVNNLDLKSNGWSALGAERKVASFKQEEDVQVFMPELDSATFKIYLSTPAVFEKGWIPENLLKQHNLQLISAAIGRSINVGGWDLESKQPKPMVGMVEAGSVYFVRAKDIDAAKKAATEIHGKSITDNLNDFEYKKQGFGIAYIGKINANL